MQLVQRVASTPQLAQHAEGDSKASGVGLTPPPD